MRRRAAALLLLLAGPLVAVPAQAETGFAAEITSLAPALPKPGDTISITVALSNPSSADVTDVTARLLVSTAPLYGRSQVPEVMAGRLLPTYRLVEAGSASGLDLASGVSTAVTLQATPRQLGLGSSQPGAYVFGVQLDGTVAGRRVTERRLTFLPWMPAKAAKPLGVTAIWTLTAPPTLGLDGIFIDDSLAVAVSPGGRLRLQLDAMRTVSSAVWLVDPLLAEAVQALAAGSRIRTDEGDVRATSDAEMQAAATWLSDLRAAVTTGSLGALPMADLDLRAAMKFGRIAVARAALSQAAQRVGAVLGADAVPLYVPLYAGAVTDSTWRFLRSAGATAAIVSDQGYPPTQSQYTPTASLQVPAFAGPVLVVDHITSATPITSGLGETSSRQAFAAQLLMTLLERPSDRRVVAVAIPPTWRPSTAAATVRVLNAPWIRATGVGNAVAAGSEQRGKVNSLATQSQQLQNVDLGRAVEQQRLLLHLTGDEAFGASMRDGVVAVLSRWWTGRSTPDRYSASTIAQLRQYARAVRVVTRGDIVFGSERGVVPVTVANGLPIAVDVVLRASGIPSVRVEPTPITRLHLNAGKRVSVELPTRVTGSGEASLLLEIVASDGTLIDGPVLLTVRSAAYARVAQYLVIVASIAMVLLIGANAFRRIRRRGTDEDDA